MSVFLASICTWDFSEDPFQTEYFVFEGKRLPLQFSFLKRRCHGLFFIQVRGDGRLFFP